MANFSQLLKAYDDYVATFAPLSEMMRLKRIHTGFVVKNAEQIAAEEGFTPEEAEKARAAALLHDTGRYEQLKRYNTFRDCDSVDHAVFSHDIVVEKGWAQDEDVLTAILVHNRRDIPNNLPPLREKICHVVRDADKLDIFRVLEAQIDAHPDWKKEAGTAFWNLKVDEAPNDEVCKAIIERRPVDYQLIKSLSDFILIQIGWMVSGLHFATSRRLAKERGHLEFRRRILHELSSSPWIDKLCDLV